MHAAWECFEAIQDGSVQTEMFPVFRGASETEDKKADNLFTTTCATHVFFARKTFGFQNYNVNVMKEQYKNKMKFKKKHK